METFMPYITVKVPSGVLGEDARFVLIKGICAAAAECEQVPDDPKMRALCMVSIEETGAGCQTFGGRDLSQMVVSFDATVNIPKGVLDDTSRARFVELLHQAAVDALPDEKRRITTSFVINEIEDGMWGVRGSLWKLPDFAAASGYRHLQHLVGDR
jgi:phenylpyruvate tautomerase PptA (4-oxalocrotonate tautomerase family)